MISAPVAPRRATSGPVGTWAWIVLSATLLAGVILSAVVGFGGPILHRRWSLLLLLGVWGAVWLVSVRAALRVPARTAIVLVVAAGFAMRLAALGSAPLTSDDLFRYSWDGRVQAAGIDPYAQPPASPALNRLHEHWLWPDPAACAAIGRAPGCNRLNRADVRTIYPPVAEAWFATVYRVSGIGAHHKAWQVAGLFTDTLTIGLILIALGRYRRDRRWVALYALSPAPVLEIVNNGHVDGLAIVFVLAALIVVAPGSGRPAPWRDYAAGALLGAAALVKLYPALLLVALAGAGWSSWTGRRGAGRRVAGRRGPGRGVASVVRASVAATGLAALAYLPHVLRVGTRVLGYLPGYLKEEHYRQGGRFLIPDALHIPHGLSGAASVIGLACVVGWVAWRRPSAPVGAAALMGGLLLATSPVQPWYAVTLLALAAVAAQLRWAAIVIAGYPYFFAVILDHPHTMLIGMICYTAALAVVAVSIRADAGFRAEAPA